MLAEQTLETQVSGLPRQATGEPMGSSLDATQGAGLDRKREGEEVGGKTREGGMVDLGEEGRVQNKDIKLIKIFKLKKKKRKPKFESQHTHRKAL